MKKSERLIHLLNFLNPVDRVSLRELAANCKTSERTIYRDIKELARIGYPIGFNEGYFLKTTAPHSILDKLTPTELRLIKFALETHPLGNVFPFAELAGKLKCSDISISEDSASKTKYKNQTTNRVAGIKLREKSDLIEVAEE